MARILKAYKDNSNRDSDTYSNLGGNGAIVQDLSSLSADFLKSKVESVCVNTVRRNLSLNSCSICFSNVLWIRNKNSTAPLSKIVFCISSNFGGADCKNRTLVIIKFVLEHSCKCFISCTAVALMILSGVPDHCYSLRMNLVFVFNLITFLSAPVQTAAAMYASDWRLTS